MSWVRVNKQNRCPICEKPDWCSVSEVGTTAVCMRVESQRPCHSGGWYHKLTGDLKPIKPVKPEKKYNTQQILAKYRGWIETRNNVLAKLWGVSENSLNLLGCRWNGVCFCIPMRDGQDRVIGIRERYENGKNLTMRGTHSGIFIPRYLTAKYLMIVEGPSDTAAALDLGFEVIGRPSCMGATDHVIALLRRMRVRAVVIMSDNDKPKRRPDGTLWRPGQQGALKLFKDILPHTRSCCIIKPPRHKDLREWYNAGGTKEDVLNLIKNTRVTYS